jgi:hypothetical protein
LIFAFFCIVFSGSLLFSVLIAAFAHCSLLIAFAHCSLLTLLITFLLYHCFFCSLLLACSLLFFASFSFACTHCFLLYHCSNIIAQFRSLLLIYHCSLYLTAH